MTFSKDLIQALCQPIIRSAHPRKIILFGSRARGEARERSDIDLAIEAPEISRRDWCTLLNELENQTLTLLPIDVIRLEEAGSAIKKRILEEGVVLYDREQPSGSSHKS